MDYETGKFFEEIMSNQQIMKNDIHKCSMLLDFIVKEAGIKIPATTVSLTEEVEKKEVKEEKNEEQVN